MPTYRMPEEHDRQLAATVAELNEALFAARASAQLAGREASDFVVRELLLVVIRQIDRAAERVRRLHGDV